MALFFRTCPGRCRDDAKLYLKEENKDFDENDTCVTESKITAKAEFVYEN